KEVLFEEGFKGEVTEGMFYGCTSLRSVAFPSTVTSVRSAVFSDSGVQEVSFASKEPPMLVKPSRDTPYVFAENPPDGFHVKLVGEATGNEEAYIQAWKYSLFGKEPPEEGGP